MRSQRKKNYSVGTYTELGNLQITVKMVNGIRRSRDSTGWAALSSENSILPTGLPSCFLSLLPEAWGSICLETLPQPSTVSQELTA